MEDEWGTSRLLTHPQEFAVLVLYAIAAVSGGLGGSAIAAHHVLVGRRQARIAYLMAYGVIGMAFGLLVAAYGAVIVQPERYADVIGPAVLAGAVGALTLSGANMTVAFLLRRLGIEVEVNLRHTEDKGGGGGDARDP